MTQLQAPDLMDQLIGDGPVHPGSTRLVDELRRQVAGYPTTPLMRYRIEIGGRWREVWLKLEGRSPWGSIKGRTAVGLLGSIADRYQPGCRLVESSSGNLGVALAALARACHAQLTVVVDERLPIALRRRMADYAIDLVLADPAPGVSDLQRRLNTVQRLLAEHPDWIWLNQYDNPANPRAHELWTAPELLGQLPEFQAAFIGVSTGGTLAGLTAGLRRAAPRTRVIGVDVQGSTVFGGPPGRRILTGIGASRASTHLLAVELDGVTVVPCWTAVGCCRTLAEATGHALGGSSGAALSACLQAMTEDSELTSAVCLCPDLGVNYRDTIYREEWVAAERRLLADAAPVPWLTPARGGLVLTDWRPW